MVLVCISVMAETGTIAETNPESVTILRRRFPSENNSLGARQTYAEFNCSCSTVVKTHKYIYGEWLPSTNYERDESKPDIASCFPVAFLPMRGIGFGGGFL